MSTSFDLRISTQPSLTDLLGVNEPPQNSESTSTLPDAAQSNDSSFREFMRSEDQQFRTSTAYLAAAREGDLTAVRTARTGFNISPLYHEFALSYAAEGGHLPVLEELLIHNVNSPRSKQSAVRALAENNHFGVIQELLKFRAIENENGSRECQLIELKDLTSTIHSFARKGNLPGLEQLLGFGAMPQEERGAVLVDSVAARSPLPGVVPNIVKALLLNGPVSEWHLNCAINWTYDNEALAEEDRELIRGLLEGSNSVQGGSSL